MQGNSEPGGASGDLRPTSSARGRGTVDDGGGTCVLGAAPLPEAPGLQTHGPPSMSMTGVTGWWRHPRQAPERPRRRHPREPDNPRTAGRTTPGPDPWGSAGSSPRQATQTATNRAAAASSRTRALARDQPLSEPIFKNGHDRSWRDALICFSGRMTPTSFSSDLSVGWLALEARAKLHRS